MRDADVRKALREKVLAKYRADGVSKVVEELLVGADDARIDAAVINGHLHGFEIKSDRDTLERLPHQITAYNKAFDYVSLVVGERHIAKATELVPSWWGLMEAKENQKGEVKLRTVRRGKINRKKDARTLAMFLWRGEALNCLIERGITGVKSKPRYILWDLLAQKVPVDELSAYVRKTLKSRQGWPIDESRKLRADSRPRQPKSLGSLLCLIHLHTPE